MLAIYLPNGVSNNNNNITRWHVMCLMFFYDLNPISIFPTEL